MDPATVAMIANFTLGLVNEFRHKNDVLTAEEITIRFNDHYTAFMKKNQQLLDETK